MSSDKTPFMKVNDSDKQRGILPETMGHTTDGNEGGWVGKAKQHKWKIIAVVAVLLLALILGLTLGGKSGGSSPSPTPPVPPTPEPINSGYNPYYLDGQSLIFTQKNKVSGVMHYNASKIHNPTETYKLGLEPIKMVSSDIPIGENNEFLKSASFEFSQVDYKITKAVFGDANKTRFSIPDTLVNSKSDSDQMSLDQVGFKMIQNPFGFEFRSTRQENVINIDTTNSDFIMTDKFMQYDLQIPSGRIYGLGERNREFSLVEGTWTMWANGRETPYDNGIGGKQTYGVHPFALIQTQQKDEWMGIFFRNSNAQSPIISKKADGNYTLTYLTTGGQMEMYFFTKGNSKEIIQAYHNLIGKPTLTPFWSLGWQATSYDYKTLAKFDSVIKDYKTAGIPLEGVFFDIPYLADYADFSVNQTSFPDAKTWSQALHTNNQKLVVIIDGGISADSIENLYYSQASDQKVLLKSTVHNDTWLTQHVWPKKTVFLDFMNEQAAMIWMEGINNLFDEIEYDGLWLDMNEATGFCDGECPSGVVPNKSQSLLEKLSNNFQTFLSEQLFEDEKNMTWYKSWSTQTEISTFKLPFSPGADNLDHMSLSLNATHVDNETEYNLHSLFGHAEGMKTHKILSNVTYNPQTPLNDKRTFLLSRSTFAGSGQYVQHWLGDNHRNWEDMRYSIAGIMNFNMFGIPMVGPDTCGFFEDKALNETEQKELCARWIELSVFYPFARQHHDTNDKPMGKGGPANEPYTLGGTTADPTLYVTMATNAIKERFSYMRHMYTCLFKVHNEGGTCFDPQMFHYPDDDTNFEVNNTEHTFIVGDAIKVTPVLNSSVTTVDSYFPNGQWVDLRNTSIIVNASGEDFDGKKGEWKNLDATKGINAHLRPGYMIPKETCMIDTAECYTTTDLRNNGKLSLYANRDDQGHAQGRLFIDQGDTLSEIETQAYEYYEFQLSANSIKKWTLNDKISAPVGNGIQSIVITNALDLQTADFACWTADKDNKATALTITKDVTMKTITLEATDKTPLQPYFIKNIYYGNSTTDLNLCGSVGLATGKPSPFYKAGAAPDLTKNTVSIPLTGNIPGNAGTPDITMTLSVLTTTLPGQPPIDVLNVGWTYTNKTTGKLPYEVPLEIAGVDKTKLSTTNVLNKWVKFTEDGTTHSFTIEITNPDDPTIIYYTLTSDMQFGEYINVINGVAHTYGTTPATFKGIMGLTEQTSNNLFLPTGVYSLWSLDTANPEQTSKSPGQNMYGTHPYYLGMATDQKSWFGVFTNLAAAQDWWITNDDTTGDVTVKTMATGGVADMYFFQGPDPNSATKAYHRIIGTPVVTPQWALGWHQCMWGYKNTAALNDSVTGFRSRYLPLETQWSDIDYMQDYKDFTVDKVNFANLTTFVADIQSNYSMKFIPIIDAGIAQRLENIDNYTSYTEGVKQDVFIKAGTPDTPIFTGQVWADDAAFPDWSAKDTTAYWGQQLTNLYNQVGFNGLWLDMNEASNMLCNGVCYSDQSPMQPVQWNLPYIPTGRNLETKSISLDAVHADKNIELDVHSLFGTQEVMATHDWFKNTQKKRTMIIERSAYAGLGKFGSRWLGDNFSKPEYMGYSVTGIMAHNIAGITLAGADICGFIDNTNAELCARWYQVGAFYPFSRNHNAWNNVPQQPWNFDGPYTHSITYQWVFQRAMFTKLHLIRYYYTQMSKVQNEGGAFYRPLFFDYPNDDKAYADQELNIMLGSAMKLGIQSKELVTSTNFYYPAGRYCQIFCIYEETCCTEYATGTSVLQRTYAFDFYLDLIAGNIVPMQNATAIADLTSNTPKHLTTVALQNETVELHIMPKCAGTACTATGDYINDDGETLDLSVRNTYGLSYTHTPDPQGTAPPTTLTLTIAANGHKTLINNNDLLGGIQIYDYTFLKFTGATYKVTVTDKTGDVDMGTTVFQLWDDRLSWTIPAGKTASLVDVTKVTFTKQ